MKTLLILVGAVAVATACAGCAGWTPPAKEAFPVKQGQEIIYSFKPRSVECIVPDTSSVLFCWR